MPLATRILQPKLLQAESVASESIKRPLKSASKAGQRRTVHFKETVSVRPITHINNISEDEIAAVWYSKNDFEDMKRSFAVTLRLFTYGELEEDNDAHCARGLEFRTRAGSLARRENKWNSLNAVLDEQDRQRGLGISNDKLLSQIYITENHHCRVSALKLGKSDEEAARAVHRSSPLEDDEMAELSEDSVSSDDEMDYCEKNASSKLQCSPSSMKMRPFHMEE